ncbi:MAG: hypothetical protein COV35_09345 [Alphaproteobacteria bacterium CG11_big_fil_rev_8_21_14_0_20_39_49]|nr:MAG: hypothetical protein COV35_09345 [Alphaproteobacteria bacterium CG11_big_fil_rev_8_21_14_0_20_39_49]
MDNEAENYGKKQTFLPFISLFTSVGTLVCCALPALLVTIGAGAVLAGLVSSVPWLVALSKYKIWTFSIAGFLIIVSGIVRYKNRNAPCPIDPKQAKACMKLRRISSVMYRLSVVIYMIGFFFAFVASKVFY